jgi:aspartate aminotransferase
MWVLTGTNDDTRPRVLILNYPMNPTGHSYTADELKELAHVARRYNLIVLSDEIYGQLHFRGEHVSIARFYPERTIVSSGLSKWCGAGGWRLGTFAFPRELRWLMKAMAAVASETYTSVCAPIQHAAIEAFRCGLEVERYLLHVRRFLRALSDRCVGTLESAGARLHPPAGAFYLFPDFTPIRDKLIRGGISSGGELCSQLLADTGVAALPGGAFARDPAELTIRLSYIDFDGAKALAACESVPPDQPLPDDLVERCSGNVLAGVRRLGDWLAERTA